MFMKNMKEYKGEKVIESLTLRMIPPNPGYPDCLCELLMTNQHLHVVEDNFNGTYQNHFTFTLAEIKEIGMAEVEKYDSSCGSGEQMGLKNFVVSSVFVALAGLVLIPGKGSVGTDNTYFVITYMNEKGGIDKIFFDELQSSAKPIVKAFKKAKTDFYSG